MSKLYDDIMKGFKEIAELKNDKKTINEIDACIRNVPWYDNNDNFISSTIWFGFNTC